MATPFDFVKAINQTKQDLFSEIDTAEVDYVPFIVNKTLSHFPDCLMYVNDLNQLHDMPKKVQFDYLRHSIRRGSRFSKWVKPEQDERLDTIREFYGCNAKTAKQYARLISDEDFLMMETVLNKGNPEHAATRGKAKKKR